MNGRKRVRSGSEEGRGMVKIQREEKGKGKETCIKENKKIAAGREVREG